MPELPEVESIRLGLKKAISGQSIIDIVIRNLKITASNSNKRSEDQNKAKLFVEGIINKKIIDIKRRAKNIIIELEDNSIILIHLKMTGQLVYIDNSNNLTIGGHPITQSYKGDIPNKHTHIIFSLTKGKLYYNDTRAFGYVLYYKNIKQAIEEGHFYKLGLEPFDTNFTLEIFVSAIKDIKNRNKILKKVLLDQTIVVGLGNIYADEVCFASGVMGDRLLKDLKDCEIITLYNNIKLILQKAIDLGGSSVSDYLLADGSRGNYAREHKVYGRAGLKCLNPNCDNILDKMTIAGRTTVYCKKCQK